MEIGGPEWDEQEKAISKFTDKPVNVETIKEIEDYMRQNRVKQIATIVVKNFNGTNNNTICSFTPCLKPAIVYGKANLLGEKRNQDCYCLEHAIRYQICLGVKKGQLLGNMIETVLEENPTVEESVLATVF